jgi:putative transcriptional regulator
MHVKTSSPKSSGIIAPPSPADIRAARKKVHLTGAEASALVHCNERSWRKWESGDREMHPAFWELFLIKCAAVSDASS